MIIQAKNGVLYVDPVVVWRNSFLTFEDGFAKAVVRSSSFKEGRKVARHYGRIIEQTEKAKFLFPVDGVGVRYDIGVSFKIGLLRPIDIPLKCKAEVTFPGDIDDFKYIWNYNFPRMTLEQFVQSGGKTRIYVALFKSVLGVKRMLMANPDMKIFPMRRKDSLRKRKGER